MAQKAVFWAAFLLGLVAVTFGGLMVAAPAARTVDAFAPAILAAMGAIMVAFLAVGLACGSANLSDDTRNAVGVGTAYTFMLVAGLFNVALVERGLDQIRALALFALVTAIVWRAGMLRVADALDPDWRRRFDSPATGAVLAILVFMGGRATQRLSSLGLDAPNALAVQLGYTALLAAIAITALLKRNIARLPGPGSFLWRALGPGVILGLVGMGIVRGLSAGIHHSPWLLILNAGTDELIVRGLFQSRWAGMGPPRRWYQIEAAFLSALMAFLINDASDLRLSGVTAILPAVACAFGRTTRQATASALIARAFITAGLCLH